MAKIVILANGSEAEEASKALEAAGIKFEVVDPTASNLLHLVIGMVDDTKPEKEEKPEKDDAPKDDTEEVPAEDMPPEEVPAEDMPTEESQTLGTVTVDGEAIVAIAGNAQNSVLFASKLSEGAKTSYSLNESVYSFYPANVDVPAHRMVVDYNKHRASLEIHVCESAVAGMPYLLVGADLMDMFKSK